MSENETIVVEFKSSREFPMSLAPFIPRNRPKGKKKRSTRIQGHNSKEEEEEEEKKYFQKTKSISYESRFEISFIVSNVRTDPEKQIRSRIDLENST